MYLYHWAKAHSNIYKRARIPNPGTHRVGAILIGTPALLEGAVGSESRSVFYSSWTLGGLVVHVCNLSTQEAEASGIASTLIRAWATWRVPGQNGLRSKILSHENKTKPKSWA